MHRMRMLVVALLAVGMSLTGLSAANAQGSGYGPRPPQIKSLGAIAAVDRYDHSIARVTGTYRCWGPSSTMHLWVSVKQGGPDPTAEGSSSTVHAWYDTNVSQDVAVNCNGAWHTTTVDLGRHPTDFSNRPLGFLKNGKAWLQFCLVPPAQDQIFASKSRWVNVTGAGYYAPPTV